MMNPERGAPVPACAPPGCVSRARRGPFALAVTVTLAATILMLPRDVGADSIPSTHPLGRSVTADTAPDVASHRAPPPVAIQIAAADVNGPVETREIVDGALQAPSGPWTVAWYTQTARPGEAGNVVMGGHVDYWDTGPAVFFGLSRLKEGAEIEVTDAAGKPYRYAVDWVRTYAVADLTPDQLREIVGPTADPSLTLITCGGEFDAARGEYLRRLVVRAVRLER